MLKFNQPYINQNNFRQKIKAIRQNLFLRASVFVLLFWFFASYLSHVFDFKAVNHINIQMSSFLLSVVTYPKRVYDDVKTSYLFYKDTINENVELKKQNVELKISNQKLKDMINIDNHLKILNEHENFLEKDKIIVRILGTVQHFSKAVIYLCLQESTKKSITSAIIYDQDGLIGRIIESSGRKAIAMLITDYQSKIPVRCKRNGVQAILSGNGNNTMDVDLIESTLDLSETTLTEGDILSTSGLDDVFLPDIPAAKVISVQDGTIKAIPCANINHTQYAFLTTRE
ncbi:MAG: hypothetical protein CNLJKLNK_00075 [Holosporales bacterium]